MLINDVICVHRKFDIELYNKTLINLSKNKNTRLEIKDEFRPCTTIWL